LKNKLQRTTTGFRRHSEALYILKQGQLESYRSSQTNSALAFSFLPEQSLTYRRCWISQFSEQLLPAQTVTYGLFRPSIPEVAQNRKLLGFSRQMAQELSQLTSALSYEQERQLALRYLVTRRNEELWGQVAMPCVCASKLESRS